MRNLRNPVGALVLFAILIGLMFNIYGGLVDNYGITKGDTRTVEQNLTNGNIVDQFREMWLIEGIAEISANIADLNPGTASVFDILGALASVGVGALKVVVGLVSAPVDIIAILLQYYVFEIPKVIVGFGTLVAVYVVFLLLSAYLRHEI